MKIGMIEIELDKLLCLYSDTKETKHLEQMKLIIDNILEKELSNNLILVENTI